MWLCFLAACLVNDDLYQSRRDALTDDDGDGYSEEDGDCDDADRTVSPGAEELCNGVDDDCDSVVDDDPVDAATWYEDGDGDGYADPDAEVRGCEPPTETLPPTDCDDASADVHPGAEEICDNGVDDDCDGAAPGCGLEGEGRASADASWVAGAGGLLTDAGGGNLQQAWVVDDPLHGVALLAGVPLDEPAGAVVELPLRGSVVELEQAYRWAPPDGLMEWAGASLVPVASDPSMPLSGFAVVARELDEGGLHVGSLLIAYDRLPSDLSAGEEVGRWSAAGTIVLADLHDLDGDESVDAVIWSQEGGGLAVLRGPLDGLDVDREPETLQHSATWTTGRSEVVFGGQVAPDWNGTGLPRVFGTALLDGGEDVFIDNLLYALDWASRGADVEDAPFLRRSAVPGHNLGLSTGSTPLAADVDGDGYVDLVLPSYADSREQSFAGSVAVVLGPHADGEQAYAPDHELRGDAALQVVGASVAVGDFDGDGQASIAVGWLDDTAAAAGGAVGLWHAPFGVSTVDELQDVVRGDVAQQQAMIARAADVDADGFDDLVVLAPGTDGVDGAIYLFAGGGL